MKRVRIEIDVASNVDERTLKHWSLQNFYWAIENGEATEVSREVEGEPSHDCRQCGGDHPR